MTAYNMVRLWCDHRDEGTGHICTEKIEAQTPGFEQAREVAAAAGWGRVAASGADEGDLCPKHNPPPAAEPVDTETDR